jgi:predicted ribosome quality control (RQC) complex YloA/Tae2 family protein
MAFDGIVVANIVKELRETILEGRISKIAQPESDALLLTIKGGCGQKRLLLSASASLPFAYLTETNKKSPMTAPNFCMLLRKFIANGKITDITQPGLERIICFTIEHLDEMGDLCRKKLIVELMGKHSNIIFCDENDRIIDSIKHIPLSVSSVREVLPGRDYFIPNTQEKKDPLTATAESICRDACSRPLTGAKALYQTYTGISPTVANEVFHRAGLDADAPLDSYSADEKLHVANEFYWLMQDVKEGNFSPCIIKKGAEPIEFSAVLLREYADYGDYSSEACESISRVLENFYADRDRYTRIRQKSADLRRIVSTALERDTKKLALQQKQLKDTEKRDKYKVYGELLQAYGYGLSEGATSIEVQNYYTNEMVTIPLDGQLTPQENAQKYFAKYNKLKRTCEALEELTVQVQDQITYLESVSNALDIAVTEEDLIAIKEELTTSGFIKKHGGKKGAKAAKSKPFHYVSSDGFDIFIGKNNLQNEELTFKVANGGDWWFHAKGMPGSHVIVKTEGKELPDRTFEEAARLAGYYSKGRGTEKMDIDYLQRKNVKKPNGSAPGFVVYYTNYSMTIHPDISEIKQVDE